MTLNLKKPKVETLKVNIGDESYFIPLGASLSIKETKGLDTFEGTLAFYKKYIPEEVLESLSYAEVNQITKAWAKETQKSSKISLGE